MASGQVARQIVAIQSQLVAERLPIEKRGLLLRQQSALWVREFPEQPFERIAKAAEMAIPLGF